MTTIAPEAPQTPPADDLPPGVARVTIDPERKCLVLQRQRDAAAEAAANWETVAMVLQERVQALEAVVAHLPAKTREQAEAAASGKSQEGSA